MLKHYLDLVRQFWMVILIGVLTTGALALGGSLLLQKSMPLFKSSVVLNMQPSDEALVFNRAFMGVTQFSPAVIITQTHIERLLSRQVAEHALDILLEESGGVIPTQVPDAFDRFKAAAWKNWNLLNYGYFSPPGERERMVNDLMGATDVEMVEGSYILLVEITYNNAELAARAANALARAFIETSSLTFADDAAAVDATLAALQAQKEAQLALQFEERRKLQRELASESVDDGRALLSAARISANQELARAERAVMQLQAELEQTDTTEEELIADIRARLSEAERLLAERTVALERNDAALQSLDATEAALENVEVEIRETENDLEELRSRRLSTELAREARMNQVGIISEAKVPTYPAFPKVFVNTVIGIILGAILMLAPIAILDVLNTRIRTSEDLRQAVGARALPTVSRGMAARARSYVRKGRRPSRNLKNFAEVMSRRFLTEGHQRWPDNRIYVTAFGSNKHVNRLHAVVEAAVLMLAPDDDGVTNQIEVVPLMEIARLGDWAPYHDSTLLIGVGNGEADASEVARMSNAQLAPGAEAFFAVVL
ncbi:hypothetical protein [Marivita sp. S2033]|uniref:hypothetical protein n=1 Tax=Marivita sp. S2033 TaxID=3373187 RepID=UPI003981B49C